MQKAGGQDPPAFFVFLPAADGLLPTANCLTKFVTPWT
jgi:hypothetical protein